MVVLGDEFRTEVEKLDKAIMLQKVELEILEALHDEAKKMRAKEISALINSTYQLVGKRTTKLQQMGLVDKSEIEGDMRNSITDKARATYFDE
jgi:DNA-binding MarR family transcriptional regulator